jgi:hypothetical protein
LEEGGIKYCGIWSAETAYAKSSMITHDGSGWVARRDTAGKRPGDNDAWQLAIKRGRDAR